RLGHREPRFLRTFVAALADKGGPVETVRAYEALFSADPLAPDHVMGQDRENAARAAMRAGMGQGPDLLSATEQQKFRDDAFRWLEIERRICELELGTGTPAATAHVRERMELWMKDSAFSTTRDPSMLLALPVK